MSTAGTVAENRLAQCNAFVAARDQVPRAEKMYWFAAYTWARHEKYVAQQMENQGIACWLPLYRSVRRWKDRRKIVDLPLFPSYVFLQIGVCDYVRVLRVPGVVHLVSSNGKPIPLSDQEVEFLRRGREDAGIQPHPFIRAGRRVRVCSGPLAGLEGVLVRKRERCRLVVSIELIQRAVCVEVDEEEVVPAS